MFHQRPPANEPSLQLKVVNAGAIFSCLCCSESGLWLPVHWNDSARRSVACAKWCHCGKRQMWRGFFHVIDQRNIQWIASCGGSAADTYNAWMDAHGTMRGAAMRLFRRQGYHSALCLTIARASAIALPPAADLAGYVTRLYGLPAIERPPKLMAKGGEAERNHPIEENRSA